jgi:hypothetical protein
MLLADEILNRINPADPVETFADEAEAIDFITRDLECVDNIRVAYAGDSDSLLKYVDQMDRGCCGSYDVRADIAGRMGFVGCNYGH